MYLHHVLKQDFIYLKLKNTLHASMLFNTRSEFNPAARVETNTNLYF